MDGKVNGWIGGLKAILRIAYSNKKCSCLALKSKFSFVRISDWSGFHMRGKRTTSNGSTPLKSTVISLLFLYFQPKRIHYIECLCAHPSNRVTLAHPLSCVYVPTSPNRVTGTPSKLKQVSDHNKRVLISTSRKQGKLTSLS